MVNKTFRAGRNSETVQENIEILTGQRGNGLDRAVTLRDLTSTNLISVSKTTSGKYVLAGSTVATDNAVAVPTTPTGLIITGGFSSIMIRWDIPRYYGHAYTEVWRATTEIFTDAALIATTPASVFGDIVSTGSTYYYWIRHVNRNNRAGAYNAVLGTMGKTSEDISVVIDDISEQMRQSALVQQLLEQDQTFSEAITRIETSSSDDNQIITKTIEQLNASYDAVSKAATATENAKITEVKEAVAYMDENGSVAYRAMWSMKASAGDITTGIGILADSNGTSQVAVSASQFFVFDPNSVNSLTPLFAISDGAVTIPEAFIKKATIQILNAQEITADYVRAGISIETPTLTSATINGAELNIGAGGSYDGFHTKITAEGIIYTDYLVASGGTLDNITINENCTVKGMLDGADGNFKGTIYGNKILGDVVGLKVFTPATISSARIDGLTSSWTYIEYSLYDFVVAGNPADAIYNRSLLIPSLSAYLTASSDSSDVKTRCYVQVVVYIDGVIVASAYTKSIYASGTTYEADATIPMVVASIPSGTASKAVQVKLRFMAMKEGSNPYSATNYGLLTVFNGQPAPVRIYKESNQFL